MKKLLLITLLLLQVLSVFAQKHDYHWINGTEHERNLDDFRKSWYINKLDFNDKQIEFESSQEIFFYQGITNASISDAAGNFLFHTNGCLIKNKMLDTMKNSVGLNPGLYSDHNCIKYWGNDIHQGAIILPMPYNNYNYYVISQRKDIWRDDNDQIDRGVNALLYAKIDMSKDGGLGEVVEKNEFIIKDEKLDQGFLTAVKHANNQDWWVMASAKDKNTFYRSLLTKNGFERTESQNIGEAMCPLAKGTGQACFSPDGTKYARFTPQCGLQLFDFNRETGLLSNPRYLENPNDDYHIYGGVAFSPNGRFLYFSHFDKIYQIDLDENTLEDGLVLVATWDGTLFNDYFPTVFHLMQLAPDCRIHINMPGYGKHWHIIQHPDNKGEACDVTQHIELPNTNRGNMPTFPNYRLGTGDVCDKSIVKTQNIFGSNNNEVVIYPNPTSGIIHIQTTKKIKKIRLVNSIGQVVMKSTISEVNMSNLPRGIYFLKIDFEFGHVVKKIIKD